jgi:TetR/AcrR family transcriptional regulator
MPRPLRTSPDRILDAAAGEFAARGFAGARVDRIARRARVNKAMLYYHFRSKQAIYRALLRRVFTLAGSRMRDIAAGPGAPADKLDRVIAGFADLIQEHPYIPGIMLREIAEAGVHLDRDTLAILAEVPRAVAGVIAEGHAAGAFRAVPAAFAYFTILGPMVMFLAAAPIRRQVVHLRLMDLGAGSPGAFTRHMQATIRRALASDAAPARDRRDEAD